MQNYINDYQGGQIGYYGIPQPQLCPSCGRCPTCGKGQQATPFYPIYPQYPVYPQGPWYGQTIITTTGNTQV